MNMTIGLIIVLAMIFILPFAFRTIEHNLEYFLLVMGVAAVILSGTLSWNLILHIFENYLLYFITAAVLIAGLIFRVSVKKIREFVNYVIIKMPITLFIFLLIVVLGLLSSLITAIIAALVLVEIVHALPFNHKQKVILTIISCFSIGLGAVLTPIGEPLSTVVVSSLSADFFYLFRNVGFYVLPCIIALGILGALYIGRTFKIEKSEAEIEGNTAIVENQSIIEAESLQGVFIRALKIFLFVIALELLGAGFKPLINTYIIHLDSRILYWINMSSAVLDNATIAAAEVSPAMSLKQIQAILMGLLISGGMLIPGNIPNIISAGKLKIKSREWAKTGVPLGLILLLIYFAVIFLF
jgi:predicted cation transporter